MSPLIDVLIQELARDPAARDLLREALGAVDERDGGRLLTTREAAAKLGIHEDTLTRAARAGRVPGAERQGVKLWRYRDRELCMLPTVPRHLGAAGPGMPRRPLEPSSTVQAIRDASVRPARGQAA